VDVTQGRKLHKTITEKYKQGIHVQKLSAVVVAMANLQQKE
jgi:hypothetical protein